LRITVLEQDSADAAPKLKSWVIDAEAMYEWKHLQDIHTRYDEARTGRTDIPVKESFVTGPEDSPSSPLQSMEHLAGQAALNRERYHRSRTVQMRTSRMYDQMLSEQVERENFPCSPNFQHVPATSGEPDPNVYCNMFKTMGPLSGTYIPETAEQVDAFAGRAHRPRNAEPFLPADRERLQQQPTPQQNRYSNPPGNLPYFHKPESRIGSAAVTLTFSALADLYKNPSFATFIDALSELLQKPANQQDRTAIAHITQALTNVAAEMNVSLHCTLDGNQVNGGGRHRQFSQLCSRSDASERYAIRHSSHHVVDASNAGVGLMSASFI
jgi:hypothetical protein